MDMDLMLANLHMLQRDLQIKAMMLLVLIIKALVTVKDQEELFTIKKTLFKKDMSLCKN